MIFFDTNWLFNNFGGTVSASSGSPQFAFDEDEQFSWNSVSEGTDGNAINVDRVLDSSVPINAIFIQDTNISNLTIEVDIGAGYIALNLASSFTLTKSQDGTQYYYLLDNTINILKIRILGSNTITANQEKTISQILAFRKLGQIQNIDSILPNLKRIQKVSQLLSGKKDIINKGRQFDGITLGFRTHYKETDNGIISILISRDDNFWIWLNDSNEISQKMIQNPFRFRDVYKVAVEGSHRLNYTDNMFFSGIDLRLKLSQVA